MISFNSSQRFFLYRGATDMRKSFNGLCGLVTNELQKPLTTGDVFMFINKPRNSIKLLVWDRNGFVIETPCQQWVCTTFASCHQRLKNWVGMNYLKW